MEKILITGGAGYIGSLLATQLVKIGHKVTVVDLLKYNKNSLKHHYNHKNFKLIKKDVRKFNFIRKLIKFIKAQIVQANISSFRIFNNFSDQLM